MFRTQFDRKQVHSVPGEREAIVRAGKLDAKKNVVVEKKGKKDLYAYINSFANSVDIHVLLARFANGDKEALYNRVGAYIDISTIPQNINEFIDMYKNGEALFASLPIEIKEKFNNNMNEFIAKIGEPEWLDIMKTSPADIRQDKIDASTEKIKKHEEAAKVQFESSVFGPVDEKPIEKDKEVVKNAL